MAAAAMVRARGSENVGFQISADVPGRQPQAPESADGQVGEILAHAFFSGQHLIYRCVHGGGVLVVGVFRKDAAHQIHGPGQDRPSRREGNAVVFPDPRIRADQGTGKNELIGRKGFGLIMGRQLPDHFFPGRGGVRRRGGRYGCFQLTDSGHGQLVMGLLHHENLDPVAEIIDPAMQILGLGLNIHPALDHPLAGGFPGLQKQLVLGKGGRL